jgi:circadian clock protein KaiB
MTAEAHVLSFLLFVRGTGARSLDAIRTVRRACAANVAANAAAPSLTVIDVFTEPKMAEKYRVIATPTLLTVGGSSERRLVGSMSEENVRDQLKGKVVGN